MLWKLDGLSEYDARRPLTPTGTNVLGVIKHLAYVEAGYFGDTFGRPFPEPTYPEDFDAMDPHLDLWATAEESREDIVGLYARTWAHAQETAAAGDVDTVGRVPWWPEERRRGDPAPDPGAHGGRDRPARGPDRHPPRAHRRERRDAPRRDQHARRTTTTGRRYVARVQEAASAAPALSLVIAPGLLYQNENVF